MANTLFFTVSGATLALLNAVTSTGAGTNIWGGRKEAGGYQQKYTWQTVVTGSPASVSVKLEGSLDGDNWYALDTSSNVSGELRAVVNSPVAFVRGNLATLTGGSSPSVTVLFMAVAP